MIGSPICTTTSPAIGTSFPCSRPSLIGVWPPCRLSPLMPSLRPSFPSEPAAHLWPPGVGPGAVVLQPQRTTHGRPWRLRRGLPQAALAARCRQGLAQVADATLACPCAAARHLGVPRLHPHGSTPRSRLRTAAAHHPPLHPRQQQRGPCPLRDRAPGPPRHARPAAAAHSG